MKITMTTYCGTIPAFVEAVVRNIRRTLSGGSKKIHFCAPFCVQEVLTHSDCEPIRSPDARRAMSICRAEELLRQKFESAKTFAANWLVQNERSSARK
jgi:hypothetical protein